MLRLDGAIYGDTCRLLWILCFICVINRLRKVFETNWDLTSAVAVSCYCLQFDNNLRLARTKP